MQLIRLGDSRGLNLDLLLSWEVERPSEPEPEPEPAPEPGPEMPVGVAETAPEGSEPPPAASTEDPPVMTTQTVVSAALVPAAVAVQPPAAPPSLTLTLHLSGGGTIHDLTLEGAEAEAMVSYLNSKSGALIRPPAA